MGRAIYEASSKWANQRTPIFFAQFTSPFFGLFCLVFSSFFLFVVPTALYTCFLSDDGYLTIIYNRDLNITEP